MSRLSGIGGVDGAGKTGSKSGLPSGFSITLVVGVAVLAVIGGVIALAAGYSLVSSRTITFGSTSTVTTSSTTSTTSTTVVASSTTSSTSSSTTLMESPVTTITTSTTTSTIGKDAIAFCMRNKLNGIYISDNRPSINLKSYFDDYAGIFPITYCSMDKDAKASCDAELNSYKDQEKLMLGSTVYKNNIGYPAVVLSKDLTAYIILSSADFEKLLGCGSLKTP